MKKIVITLSILMLTQAALHNSVSAQSFDCPDIRDPKPAQVVEWGYVFGAKLIGADYNNGPQYSVNIWEVSNASLNDSLDNMDRQVRFAGGGTRNAPGPRGNVHEVITTPLSGNKAGRTRVAFIVQWDLAPRSGPGAQANGAQFGLIWSQFTRLVHAYNWTITKNPSNPAQYTNKLYTKFHRNLCRY